MKFGYFDDSRREYVISTPATPLPWINYLGSEDFLGMISNTAGGYCFYRDAKLQRILPGIPVFYLPEHPWTATNAVTAWATPPLTPQRTVFGQK